MKSVARKFDDAKAWKLIEPYSDGPWRQAQHTVLEMHGPTLHAKRNNAGVALASAWKLSIEHPMIVPRLKHADR